MKTKQFFMGFFSMMVSLYFFILVTPSWSAVPPYINFQGFLTDANGKPVADSVYSMRFGIWDGEEEVTANRLWKEEQSVAVKGGVYTVNLGAIVPFSDPNSDKDLSDTLTFAVPYFLSIEVKKDDASIWDSIKFDGKFLPLTSMWFSFRANTSAGRLITIKTRDYQITENNDIVLVNGDTSVSLPSAVNIPGRMFTIKKVDSEGRQISIVTLKGETIDEINRDPSNGGNALLLQHKTEEINVVSDGKNWIRIGNIDAEGIPDSTIRTPKLVDNVITNQKLDSNSVTSDKIADATIKNADIAENAITSEKIQNGVITNSDISSAASIDYAKLNLKGAIKTDDIINGSVTYDKTNLVGQLSNRDLAESASIDYSKLNLTDRIMTKDLKARSITSEKLALSNGDIPYSAVQLSDKITNADIAASAGIAYTKLQLTGAIGTSEIKDQAVTKSKLKLNDKDIPYSSLDMTDKIVNADLAANASVAYSKLNLTGAIQTKDIADGAITDSKIKLNAAINTQAIADNAVTYTKLNLDNGSIPYDKVNMAGKVTNRDIANAASVDYTKLNLTGAIQTKDLANASVTYEKTNLTGKITDADISNDAKIAYYKLALKRQIATDDLQDKSVTLLKLNLNQQEIPYQLLNLTKSITNADIADNAAIAYTKINFSGTLPQNVLADNSVNYTKLNIRDKEIPYQKLNLNAQITNSDIADSASVAYSKLNLQGQILNRDIKNGAVTFDKLSLKNGDIPYDTLFLTGRINDADVAPSASIAYTKLNLKGAFTGDTLVDKSITYQKLDLQTKDIQYDKIDLTSKITKTDIAQNAGIEYTQLNLANGIKSEDIKDKSLDLKTLKVNESLTGKTLSLSESASISDVNAHTVNVDTMLNVTGASKIDTASTKTLYVSNALHFMPNDLTPTTLKSKVPSEQREIFLPDRSGTVVVSNNGVVDETMLSVDSVTSEKIKDGAIKNSDLADNAIDSKKLNIIGNGGAGQLLTSDGLGGLIWANSGQEAVRPARIITVAAAGADYTNIKDALNNLSTGINQRYIINVAPGTYSGQIVLKPFVCIKGSGQSMTIIANSGDDATVIGESDAIIENVSIISQSTGQYAIGVRTDGKAFKLDKVTIQATGGVTNYAIDQRGGSIEVSDSIILGTVNGVSECTLKFKNSVLDEIVSLETGSSAICQGSLNHSNLKLSDNCTLSGQTNYQGQINSEEAQFDSLIVDGPSSLGTIVAGAVSISQTLALVSPNNKLTTFSSNYLTDSRQVKIPDRSGTMVITDNGTIGYTQLEIDSVDSDKIKNQSIRSDDIEDKVINASKLSVDDNGTSGQVLVSKGDGGFLWQTVSLSGQGGIQSFTEITAINSIQGATITDGVMTIHAGEIKNALTINTLGDVSIEGRLSVSQPTHLSDTTISSGLNANGGIIVNADKFRVTSDGNTYIGGNLGVDNHTILSSVDAESLKLTDFNISEARFTVRNPWNAKTLTFPDKTGLVVISADSMVGYTEIKENSVDSPKIIDGTITNADIADDAGISYSKLNMGNSIKSSDLVNGSVTSAKLALSDKSLPYTALNLSGSITSADLAPGAITYSLVNLTNFISSKDIKDGEVTTSDLAQSAIVPSNLYGINANGDFGKALMSDGAGGFYWGNASPWMSQQKEMIYNTKFGSSGSANGEFTNPYGVGVDSKGNIFVTCRSNHRVQKFTNQGVFILTFGTKGSAEGQFNTPRGLAVDKQDNVYVVDTMNHRVQKFDNNGNYLLSVGTGSAGSNDGQFNSPFEVAVDSFSNIYVVDTTNNRVQIFDKNGVFVKKFGSAGNENGQFNSPYGIAVDSSRNIYVADTFHHYIQKFDSNGVFLHKFGVNGTESGQFNTPFHVALDIYRNIYVVDTMNNRIQKFDNNGNFSYKFGSQGSQDGQFNTMSSMAVDESGKIYIADTANNRVQIFKPIYPIYTIETTGIGINTGTPYTSAVMQIDSTQGGLLIPRMTKENREAIPNPVNGLMVYETDAITGGSFYYYNGSQWINFKNNIADQAITNAKISDNNVSSTKLKVTGTPTIGQSLVSDGSDGFLWKTISDFTQVVTVGKGGKYATIASALSAISDASAATPYLLKIAPGVYTEQITLKTYVNLEGSGESMTVINFTGNNIESDAWTLKTSGYSQIKNLTIQSSGSGKSYAVGILNQDITNKTKLSNVTVTVSGATTSNIGVTNTNSSVDFIDVTIIGGTGIKHNSGTALIRNSQVIGAIGSITISSGQLDIIETIIEGTITGTGCKCSGVYDSSYTFYSSTCP